MAADRLRELLLNPTESTGGTRPFRPEGKIELKGAGFHWGSGERVLGGIDLCLHRGRIAGLWGPNGAGKSTLLSLLNRTRLPTEGQMLIDGVPAEEFSLGDLRTHISHFPGETSLFQGSIADNLILGRALPDPDEALARLEELGFEQFLERFPNRWRTEVGEGGRRLSAGERQAVGLMRALVGDPELILVDEGLRSSDGQLSAFLLRVLLEFGRRRFLLIVSHDASTLRHVDDLYLLEDGCISREGSPPEIFNPVAPAPLPAWDAASASESTDSPLHSRGRYA